MSKKKKVTTKILQKHWVHSHEEDTPEEMIFRPATYGLPRSRGRRSFELKPDGTLSDLGIGPTDRPEETRGTWKLEGDKLIFYRGGQSSPSRVMQITSVDKDRLVIKK